MYQTEPIEQPANVTQIPSTCVVKKQTNLLRSVGCLFNLSLLVGAENEKTDTCVYTLPP